jgi:predicted amidohydrolase
MRVALAQLKVISGEFTPNLKKVNNFVKRAKKRKADIIVFPEYSLTGSVKGNPHLVKIDKRKIFRKLAKENKIDIVSCFIESENRRWYNTACYFDRRGRIIGTYRKINLWHTEKDRISHGKKITVFNTRFGKVGLAICWDLSNPLNFRSMAKKGANIIFVPSFWSTIDSNPITEARNIDSLCYARAFENELAMVFVNPAGDYVPGDPFVGHSQVTLPIKGPVKKLDHNKESLIVVDIPEKYLAIASKVYKIRKNLLNKQIRE